ncbi:MAG: ADP-ribosylation factor-like protein, partial [Promethearchaeota archaeon]
MGLTRQDIIKISLLGAGGVGKSTLVARLVSGNFIERSMTVGVDIDTWMVLFDDLPASKITFFDFGGQEQFRFFQAPLMVGAKIALIVFDCSSYRTLLAIEEWMPITCGIPDQYKLLIANKIDNPNLI